MNGKDVESRGGHFTLIIIEDGVIPTTILIYWSGYVPRFLRRTECHNVFKTNNNSMNWFSFRSQTKVLDVRKVCFGRSPCVDPVPL